MKNSKEEGKCEIFFKYVNRENEIEELLNAYALVPVINKFFHNHLTFIKMEHSLKSQKCNACKQQNCFVFLSILNSGPEKMNLCKLLIYSSFLEEQSQIHLGKISAQSNCCSST